MKTRKFYTLHSLSTSSLPSFSKGIGSIMNITGSFKNPLKNKRTDAEILQADGKVVCHDFAVAFDNLKKEGKRIGKQGK
jgi:hypothetical protein